MGDFFIIPGVTMIVVGLLATLLKRHRPNKKFYLLPGSVLIAISFILTIVVWFTSSNGWSILGYSFLSIYIFIGAIAGTIMGRAVAKALK